MPPYIGMRKGKVYVKDDVKKPSPTLVKQIRGIVKNDTKRNSEFKQFAADISVVGIYGGSGGALLTHLTPVVQGVADNQRVGDQLTLNSINIRGVMLSGDGATANRFNDIRIVVFQYKDSDMNPLVSEMFLSNTVTSAAAQNAYSNRNIDYLAEYNFLYDKTYHLDYGLQNASNYGQTGILSKHFEIKVPLKWVKKKVQFTAATTNTVNGIWLMAIGSSASVATNPSIGFSWSVGYTDK